MAAFGGDPDAVLWRSKEDELAPVDIFRSGLLEAGAYGDGYYIYRVTDTNTATPKVTRWEPDEPVSENQGRLLLSGDQMELGLSTATDGSLPGEPENAFTLDLPEAQQRMGW